MKQAFEIPGRLPGANEYTKANRTNCYMGAKEKKEAQKKILAAIKDAKLKPVGGKINVHVNWIEKNERRDKDNIRFGIKFILDALVQAGIIPNDGWTYIGSFTDVFFVNKKNARIIVEIEEV